MQTDRHAEELKAVVEAIRGQGKKLESLIQKEYHMTIEEAISELEKIKASMIKVIYFLSKGISPVTEKDAHQSNPGKENGNE